MLVVVSPAKKLDETPTNSDHGTRPVFADEARVLAEEARKLGCEGLMKLMHISAALGDLNAQRFQKFGSDQHGKPAIEMFAGDTYSGLDAASLDEDALRYGQEHLNILSGLYGLLRPGDRIEPHRLEMGTRLKNQVGKNLYAFWREKITEELNQRAVNTESSTIVNCASVEYFSAISVDDLQVPVVTPQFLELKNGAPKVVSFFAKKARGAMARYIVQNIIKDQKSLKDFDLGGYVYQPKLSTQDAPVFLRKGEDQA